MMLHVTVTARIIGKTWGTILVGNNLHWQWELILQWEHLTRQWECLVHFIPNKFNFSNYIFDNMVRNVDSPSKFLMYPRFLKVIINAQVDDLSSHNNQYASLALTQKVFANMRRVRKGFSRVETPLFASMLVQPQDEVEEDDVEAPNAPTPPSP
nr:hypothetical protein [Tanacetum cinerariifolium]